MKETLRKQILGITGFSSDKVDVVELTINYEDFVVREKLLARVDA
ncbi:MAG: hypothetical protein QGG23_05280 [Candidatus Bathyarchaeota archaeon]|nr:hypothetical protein [Candidatus Bathyarchaeota archaeon]